MTSAAAIAVERPFAGHLQRLEHGAVGDQLAESLEDRRRCGQHVLRAPSGHTTSCQRPSAMAIAATFGHTTNQIVRPRLA